MMMMKAEVAMKVLLVGDAAGVGAELGLWVLLLLGPRISPSCTEQRVGVCRPAILLTGTGSASVVVV